MKHLLDRLGVSALALFLLAFAMPSSAAEATKISDVAHSVFFRGGSGTRGAAGTNGGHYSDRYFNGNFTDYTYCNGSGTTELVVDVSHIVTDPDGQAYVTDVLIGHQGNAQYSLYYTNEPEPENLTTYASDPRTWTPIAGADHVQEAGTKTYGVNDFATAVKYVFNTCPNWTTHLAEIEVQGYEYVPPKAVKISAVGRSVFFRGGSGTRGAAGTNGGHYSDRYFNGNFTDYTYCNGSGVTELVIPTTGLDDQGNDTGVAWYVTDFKVGHQGNAQYSLYYTTEAEPANLPSYASDPRTWTLIAGADHVQEAGTKTFGVNAFATAVKYVFNTCPNWTTHLAEVEVWAMNPSSITCLHPNMTDDYPAWNVCTAATCTTNAFEERFCPDCGARFEREVPLSKLGHDFVATLTTNGTATAYGSGYVECSRCNEFHLVFDGDTVDLTTLGGPPINGVVQYTDLTVSSTGAEDGGVKPLYLMDGYWDNGWGHAWYSGDLGTNEWVQYAFGTTIDLTKIEYSVINESQTVYFSSYDPATGEETLLRTIPIKKDTTEGAPGYQRKTEMFFGEGDVEHVFVDAVRMRIGDYVDPDTGETTAYRGYNYGANDRHVIVCEFHPWGTIAGAGMTATPVAMIGDASYMSIAAALASITNDTDTTIVLQKNIDLTGSTNNVTIPVGVNVTLDLHGNSIAGDVDGDILVAGALTLRDTKGGGKIYAVAPTGKRGLVRVEGGTFNMTGGAIESVPDSTDPGKNGSYAVVYRANSTVNVSGGTITAGWFCLSGNGKDDTGKESAVTISGGTLLSTADYAVYFPNAGTLTISGNPRISGAAGALTARNGTVSITGGTFMSSGTGDIQPGTDGTAGLGDVAVNIVGQYGPTEATISGGSFTAQENAVVLSAGNNGATLAVSGGTFSQPVLPAYCAPGFVPVANEDGGTTTYGVKRAWVVTFVNEKGDAPAAQVVDVVAGTDAFATEPDPAPTATGFTFDGWFADGAAAAWDFANDAVTADLVLTAGWTLDRHAVAFEWHGGAVTNEYDYGTAAADVAVPRDPPTYVENDTIYTFTGWSAAVPETITADVTITAQYSSAAATARVNGGAYATLAEAIAAAQDGDTVLLLDDVTLDARVEPNLGADTTLVIDLGGNTITRTGTSGNGSAFDVKSGSVTITNGVVDCTQDDTAIVADGVYAITARAGSAVTLADLTVTVDSECGACVYPFAGATATILGGTYANTTKTPYRYKTAWTGMAVNQANKDKTGGSAVQLVTIYGGSFSLVDPALGDDSWSDDEGTFLAPGYATVLENGFYVVQEAPAVEVKPDAPVEIEAESQADAEAKAAAIPVVIDDAAAAAAGQAEVLKKVVAYDGTTGKYVVSVEIDEEKVELEETVAEVAGSLATVSDATPGTSTEVAIPAESVTPGLYYSVSMVTDLSGADWNAGEGDRELATDEGVALSVPKPANGDKAFYKVLVNMTDND